MNFKYHALLAGEHLNNVIFVTPAQNLSLAKAGTGFQKNQQRGFPPARE
jgi:hypothetical protein